jgi:hypothetical protein
MAKDKAPVKVAKAKSAAGRSGSSAGSSRYAASSQPVDSTRKAAGGRSAKVGMAGKSTRKKSATKPGTGNKGQTRVTKGKGRSGSSKDPVGQSSETSNDPVGQSSGTSKDSASQPTNAAREVSNTSHLEQEQNNQNAGNYIFHFITLKFATLSKARAFIKIYIQVDLAPRSFKNRLLIGRYLLNNSSLQN